MRERFQRLAQAWYKLVYPYANLSYELALLAYNIAYIFDQTPYYRPWLQLMGVDLRRMSASDHVRVQSART